jgi:gamma-glutamylcyclotransferase
MSIYYFAYGSNMLSKRMRSRIPDAEIVGIAFLSSWKFVWDKISKDNSAKANLMAEQGNKVWGILYRLPDAKLDDLDKVEGGYQRINVIGEQVDGNKIPAVTYISDNRAADLLPFDWYKKIVLEGAQEHSLPPGYISAIMKVESIPDTRKSAGESS